MEASSTTPNFARPLAFVWGEAGLPRERRKSREALSDPGATHRQSAERLPCRKPSRPRHRGLMKSARYVRVVRCSKLCEVRGATRRSADAAAALVAHYFFSEGDTLVA